MSKKYAVIFTIIVLTLLITSIVVFADTYSSWSPKYSGVQYQYVNGFGGNDWDGIRWDNGNSYKAEVTYSVKQSDDSKTNNIITLAPGETSGVSAIAKGARVASISVKSVK